MTNHDNENASSINTNIENNLYLLIKFGEKSHMQNLLDNGTLFMRRLKEYRKIEHDAIGDEFEGISYSCPLSSISMSVNGKPFPLNGPGFCTTDAHPKFNPFIYCMYALTTKHLLCQEGQYIDDKCFSFGNTAVIIHDIMKFYERLKDACMRNKFNIEAKTIEYVDQELHDDKMGSFRKFDYFKYQHEWRAIINNAKKCDDTMILELELGSLKDIAYIVPVQEINQVIKFDKFN